MKNKVTAAILAFFLGGLGIHQFYLGNGGKGILYLLFCWTLVPSIIAFIDFIILLSMSDADFNAKYNGMATIQAGTFVSHPGGNVSAADELGKLSDLRAKGVISELEFEQQKSKVLANG